MKRVGLKVLVLGGGGREHALAWKLAASPRVARVFCAPGNPGTEAIATNLPWRALEFEPLVRFARQEGIDLVVAGPTLPLIRGAGDHFRAAGIPFFGPDGEEARLEGSKVFSKGFMQRHGIPTPHAAVFTDPVKAEAYVRERWSADGLVFKTEGLAVKADGYSVRESVVVARQLDEGLAEVHRMAEGFYGPAGARILVEDRLYGPEASFIAFVDGRTWKALPSAQDHKPLLDGNLGPNTEGMGAFVPSPTLDAALVARIGREVMEPTLAGMAAEDLAYPGVLYVGLMLTADGPQVLEYNCRFGDPEAQVLLAGMQGDLVDVIQACLEGRLYETELGFDPDHAYLVVVGAAPGYPHEPATGRLIMGLDEAAKVPDVTIFHALSRRTERGIETAGGRVVNALARGRTLDDARRAAYEAMDRIRFEGGGPVIRTDLGAMGLVAQP